MTGPAAPTLPATVSMVALIALVIGVLLMFRPVSDASDIRPDQSDNLIQWDQIETCMYECGGRTQV